MRPANERRRYIVMPSFIGLAHTIPASDGLALTAGTVVAKYWSFLFKIEWLQCQRDYGQMWARNWGTFYSETFVFMDVTYLIFSIRNIVHGRKYAWYRPPLKAESLHDANFLITDDTTACRFDSLWCHKCRQSCHHDNFQFSTPEHGSNMPYKKVRYISLNQNILIRDDFDILLFGFLWGW